STWNPMKVKDTKTAWEIKCRACGWHSIPKNRSWTYNGDSNKPTFQPSMNEVVNSPTSPRYVPQIPTSRCHFIITDGKIIYIDDCTHSLRGTFELEDWTAGELLRPPN